MKFPKARRSSLLTDGRHLRIVTADVQGRFTRARRWLFAFLVLLLLVLPFVKIRGAPGIWLDVPSRRFHILGLALGAQDTYLAFFALTGLAVTIVVLTGLLGRVWCGYTCPQTVFLEGVYRPIERLILGSRGERNKREPAWWRRVALQAVFVALSSLIAHVFVLYFVSWDGLVTMMRAGPLDHLSPFVWATVMTVIFYINFARFREQTCLVICPYGRMQSVLFDRDTLIVGYDTKRGEPRTRGKAKAEGAGDCVSCDRCVVVCPTGIDIREGLQVDCVACAACVDACDDVMTRLGRPKGLIRYDSENGFEGKKTRLLRPRMGLYAALVVIGALVAFFTIRQRTTYAANVLRLAGPPYELVGDEVRNTLEVHIVNKSDTPAHFDFASSEPPGGAGLTLTFAASSLDLAPFESRRVPLFVTGPRGAPRPVRFHVRRAGEAEAIELEAQFLGPNAR